MSRKEELLEQAGESYGYLEQTIQKRIELAKLEVIEKSSLALSSLVIGLLIVFLLTLMLFCLVLAAGFALASWTGSMATAFLLLAGGFLILGLLSFFLRSKWLVNPIVQIVAKQILTQDE